MLHQIKEPDFLTFTCSTEQHRHHLFLMMNCYLKGLIFESDTSVKHVLHLPLPCPFVVDLTRKALSALCLCPRLAQIPSRHNSAAAAQIGDAQIDFENVGSEKYSICFDREFTFCSAHHVQHPWLIVQRFSLFSVEQNREWILNTCWDRAETIEFLLDFVKDEDKYFCFLHTESCKCVQRLLGRQISDNTLLFFWTLLFKKNSIIIIIEGFFLN